MEDLIKQLKGPILILGSNGFIGSNLYKRIREVRSDCSFCPKGIFSLPEYKTIFNAAGKSKGSLYELMESNVHLVNNWLSNLKEDQTFIHAGSQAEYRLDNDYAITKRAGSAILHNYGKRGLRACSLLLYTVYGEYDNPNNLIPRLKQFGVRGKLPPLGDPGLVYDFIHVDDVCRAFFMAALNLKKEDYGDGFDVGTGVETTLNTVVNNTIACYQMEEIPQWNSYKKKTDYELWSADVNSTEEMIGFKANIELKLGMRNYFGGDND